MMQCYCGIRKHHLEMLLWNIVKLICVPFTCDSMSRFLLSQTDGIGRLGDGDTTSSTPSVNVHDNLIQKTFGDIDYIM